jgi:hypothetical protein
VLERAGRADPFFRVQQGLCIGAVKMRFEEAAMFAIEKNKD